MKEGDEGAQLQLVATSTDSDGSGTTATSAATGTVTDPAPTLSIALSGTAQQGRILTAIAVASSGDAVISYQWQLLNGATWTNITGATASTYLVTEANEGHQIRVITTSSDADGGSASATSAATAPVIDVTPTLSVTVSGIAQQGRILTAIPKVISDGDGGRTIYQWQEFVGSNWVNITGATHRTYRATEADEGHMLRVLATFTDDTGQRVSAASAATGPVIDIKSTVSVSVSGRAQEGQTLTAHVRVTGDADGGATAYQWQRLVGATWTNIAGAAHSTYRATEADEGHKLRVLATYTNDTGQKASAASAATGFVIDILPTLSVSVSGTAREGQILMATAHANDADVVMRYQWQQLIGGTWTNISGATAASYAVTEVNEGRRLRVVATSSDSDGFGASATSAATASVSDPAPTLTITNPALFVAAGGSVSLPIGVSGFDSDDKVSVKIAGLPVFETITDALDNRTFSGSSVTLTAAEVNSGLTLHSTYAGSGQPVNILTVTATNTTVGESATSSAKTITVTDPPTASRADPNVQPVNTLLWAIVTSPLGAGSPTFTARNQSPAVTVGLTPTPNNIPTNNITYAVGDGRTATLGKATVRLSGRGAGAEFVDQLAAVTVARNGHAVHAAPELPGAGRDAGTSGPGVSEPATAQSADDQRAASSDTPIMVASVAAGPIGEQARISAMVGPALNARDLAAALFFGGVAMPRRTMERAETHKTVKGATKPRRPRIVTFDLADDRFDGPAGSMADVADLPPMIETDGEGVEWTVV